MTRQSPPPSPKDSGSTPRDQQRDLAERIEEISPSDGATVMDDLPAEQAADLAEYLDPDTTGRIFSEMEPQRAASVLQDMGAPEASAVISAMEPDDRVDILEHVSPAAHDAIIGELNPEDAADVRRLEQYPPDTAGGIMTTEVTALPEDLTVGQAIDELRRLNEQLEQMFYVYVIDRRRHLIGVLSMRDLILAKPDKPLAEVMHADITSVPATMDQEHVARLMRKFGFLALPVTDERGRLIGLITADDVLDVLQEEATEDVLKMVGAGPEERLTSPWQYSFRKRIWWLEVNLATAYLAASVVAMFDNVIAAVPILAAYQTIVSGMGGNAGAQAMAVAIRGLALGEHSRRRLIWIVGREAIVGAFSGVTVGATTFLVGIAHIGGHYIFGYHDHPYVLGGVVCAALIVNHFLACTTGLLLPFVMKWLGFDPAQSSTIFATTITDCCGFFSTLGIAELCMRWLK
ncbi:MAG TPA: magnesium transporter [Tepidisphaeraceae bacterium]|jgi:magnesium transporter|nr:magnesium transporter [Tepidisphaeraceae bacterium]